MGRDMCFPAGWLFEWPLLGLGTSDLFSVGGLRLIECSKRSAKALVRLSVCAGGSEALLFRTYHNVENLMLCLK